MKTKKIKPYKPFKASEAHIKKKTDEAIKLLNEVVRIKLAPSPVHGVGVFAMRDINKNTKLDLDALPHAFDVPYKKFKELRPEIAEYLIGQWPRIVGNQPFLYPDTKRSSYVNHNSLSNYDPDTDKTTEKIKKGQEVFADYRKIEGWQTAYPWLVDKGSDVV